MQVTQAVVPEGGRWEEAVAAGRFDEAEKLYLLAGKPDSDVREALANLADLLTAVREKAWARARRRLEKIATRPAFLDWEALSAELDSLADTSGRLGQSDPDEVLADLSRMDVRWFRAEHANQLGTALIYAGRVEAALLSFQDATALDARHYRALTNLGNAYLEDEKVDEAIAAYEKALAINDEFANAHHNLGVAYRRKGQIAKSVRHLRRAQRMQGRIDRERAREEIGSGASQAGVKALRWTLYIVMAIALYFVLRGQGFI